jgi:hypothetical protein
VIKGMAEAAEKRDAEAGAGKGGTPGAGPAAPAAPGRAAAEGNTPGPQRASAAGGPPGVMDFVLLAAIIFGIAFAAPFLSGVSNIMGIIIIGIALYEAWKLNKRVAVTGPFRFGAEPGVAAAAPPPPAP